MTVACRFKNCPLNNNDFCCAESILIDNVGRCFNLVRGFSPEDDKKLRETTHMDIEEVEFDETPGDPEKEGVQDDNDGSDEGTRDDEI